MSQLPRTLTAAVLAAVIIAIAAARAVPARADWIWDPFDDDRVTIMQDGAR